MKSIRKCSLFLVHFLSSPVRVVTDKIYCSNSNMNMHSVDVIIVIITFTNFLMIRLPQFLFPLPAMLSRIGPYDIRTSPPIPPTTTTSY